MSHRLCYKFYICNIISVSINRGYPSVNILYTFSCPVYARETLYVLQAKCVWPTTYEPKIFITIGRTKKSSAHAHWVISLATEEGDCPPM